MGGGVTKANKVTIGKINGKSSKIITMKTIWDSLLPSLLSSTKVEGKYYRYNFMGKPLRDITLHVLPTLYK